MTKSHAESVREDLQESAEYRRAFLGRAVANLLSGEVDLGKHMLRKYVNGTVGFVSLGEALGKSSKTLMQMLSAKGNPHIRNFFEIVAYLQKVEGLAFEVVEARRPAPRARKAAKKSPAKKTLKKAA